MRFLTFLLFIFCLSCGFPLLSSSPHLDLSKQPACVITELAPDTFVNNTVNVIDGNFYFSMHHLRVPGHIPLDLVQYYNSQSSYFYWLGTGMSLNYSFWLRGHLHSEKKHDTHGKYSQVFAEAPGGSILIGLQKFNSDGMTFFLDPDVIHEGLTNIGSGRISARTNLKNISFKTKYRHDGQWDWTAYLPDGSVKKYHRTNNHFAESMNLKEEERPNRSKLYYSYYKYHEEEGLPRKITAMSKEVMNRLWFKRDDKHLKATISSSNGKSVHFKYFEKNDCMYIFDIDSQDSPHIHFNYTHAGHHYCIDRVSWPDERFLEVQYDHKARVIAQKAPVSKNGDKHTIWSFSYHPDEHYTKVVDANDNKRIYRYENKKLTALEEYMKHDLFRVHAYVWGKDEGLSWGERPKTNAGNLLTEAVLNGEKKAEYARHLSYDSYGNVTKDTTYGNLSGTCKKAFSHTHPDVESCHRYYTYSNDHLRLPITESQDSGPNFEYRYIAGTDLMWAKFTKDGSKIILREFYSYDDDGILTEKVVDDGDCDNKSWFSGVTTRLITTIEPIRHREGYGQGLPHVVREYYMDLASKEWIFLKRTVYNYNKAGDVIEEAYFDSTDTYRYSNFTEYDEKGRVSKKTNEIKHVFRFGYDANNNKTYERQDGAGYCTRFEYDKANRLVSVVQEHDDGTKVRSRFTYDFMSNKTSSTDRYGATTYYDYDSLNRVVKITFPQYTIHKEYDIFDNVTRETNQNGAVTTYEYNARKQPTCITYADGTKERFEYNLNGTLTHNWDRSGTKTSYCYDVLGRVTETSVYDALDTKLSTTTNRYNALHLVSSTDAMGYTTYYRYDEAGRKIEEYKEGNKTTFEYNELGQLCRTKAFINDTESIATFVEYDEINRITLDRKEDAAGEHVSWNYYVYDLQGNCTLKQSGYIEKKPSEVHMRYNSQNELIEVIDELGNSTKIHIDHGFINIDGHNTPRKIVTDALGNITEEYTDRLGRVVSILKKNAQGVLLAQSDYAYNGTNNKIKQTEHVIVDGQIDHDYTIRWEYDALDRVTKLIEQDEKTTSYEYDASDRVSVITKPDEIRLVHIYDALGRLSSLRSSDDTVAYSYAYDLHHNPLEVRDEIHGHVTKRAYDAWNRLTEDGPIQHAYDSIGRQIKLVAPDGSAVEYEYLYANLHKVKRVDASNKLLYEHCYKVFDKKGRVMQSELIANLGPATFTWDKMGRNTGIATNYFTQEIPPDGFDAVGNLKNYSFTDAVGQVDVQASYDDLYQLIEEHGFQDHVYKNDSVNNRLAKNNASYSVDALNKIVSDGESGFTYDKNGNPIEQKQGDVTITYAYDALDRLVKVTKGSEVTSYLYDSFNRRIARTRENETEHFLYQGLREIGTLGKEFRVLGLGKGAEFGASVAIELDGKVFAPIHDFRGNIVALVDTDSGRVVESYRYTAFGECAKSSFATIQNPWRFASKRYDEETGFVYFSKRYYAPNLGRWFTPDPLGFADGPNMYAYVHNSPLTRFDLFGLYGLCEDDDFDLNAQIATGKLLADLTVAIVRAEIAGVVGVAQLEWAVVCFTGDLLVHPIDTTKNIYNTVNEKVAALTAMTPDAVVQDIKNNPIDAFATVISTCTNPSSAIGNMGKGSKLLHAVEKEQKIIEQGTKVIKGIKGSGKGKNKLKPDPKAQGEHTVFRRDPKTGTVSHYATYKPQTNPRKNFPWEPVQRYDGYGSDKHYNKKFKRDIFAPHIHDPTCEGGVRPAEPFEIPK